MQIEKGIDKIVKTIRVMIQDKPGYLGRVASAIGASGGNIGDIRLVTFGLEYNTRDITVFVDDEAQLQAYLAQKPKRPDAPEVTTCEQTVVGALAGAQLLRTSAPALTCTLP